MMNLVFSLKCTQQWVEMSFRKNMFTKTVVQQRLSFFDFVQFPCTLPCWQYSTGWPSPTSRDSCLASPASNKLSSVQAAADERNPACAACVHPVTRLGAGGDWAELSALTLCNFTILHQNLEQVPIENKEIPRIFKKR